MKNRSIKTVVVFVSLIAHSFLHAFNFLDNEFLAFQQQISNKSDAVIFSPTSVAPDSEAEHNQTRAPGKKSWTFIVYMAADNDLRAFAANNLKQMAAIGSNKHINIVVHLDIRLNGNQKVTRRYYIEKNKLVMIETGSNKQKMDSGDPQTLISFCNWAITSYSAQNYALIMWNHGTGIIDPKLYKVINPAELFIFNPSQNRFDLDRSVGFLDILNQVDLDQRGICWDNSTGNYLTNQKFEAALKEICSKTLHGKFKLIGFDACLMSMIEIANYLKDYAEIMVGSQEVELGTGWNYSHILEPFLQKAIGPQALAAQIVNAYKDTYKNITFDYTQSAINLQLISQLESNIHTVGQLLLECLQKQQGNSVRNAIAKSRNRNACTHFDEPSYIDLHHFYSNVQANIGQFKLTSSTAPINRLSQALAAGKKLIEKVVLANHAGKNLRCAKGLSVYLPEQRVHQSYIKSRFYRENAWSKFVDKFAS